jgi:hypothetical protein
MFQVDGVDILFEKNWLRQRVYCDHQLVSERRTWAPRLWHVHRFVTERPPRQFELRAYEAGGVLLFCDGRLVAERQPGKAQLIMLMMFAAVGLLRWVEYARNGQPRDLVASVLWTMLVAAGAYVHWSWRRARRRASNAPPSP